MCGGGDGGLRGGMTGSKATAEEKITEGPNAIIQFRRDVAATLLRLVQDLSKLFDCVSLILCPH